LQLQTCGYQPFRAVGKPHSNAIAFFNTEVYEAKSEGVDGQGERRPSVAVILMKRGEDGHGAVLCDLRIKESATWLLEEGVVLRRVVDVAKLCGSWRSWSLYDNEGLLPIPRQRSVLPVEELIGQVLDKGTRVLRLR
jgi:hypothetical protein